MKKQINVVKMKEICIENGNQRRGSGGLDLIETDVIMILFCNLKKSAHERNSLQTASCNAGSKSFILLHVCFNHYVWQLGGPRTAAAPRARFLPVNEVRKNEFICESDSN